MNGSPRIKERPSSPVITECQKYVRCRIERRWLALYKASKEYKDKQSPKQNVSEVVEDIMLRRRLQRSEAAWRVSCFSVVSSYCKKLKTLYIHDVFKVTFLLADQMLLLSFLLLTT